MSRLDNRPLLGTADRDLFVVPEPMPAVIRAVDRRLNVLLLGPPGAGKTTLLRALEVDLDGGARAPVYVDLSPARDAAQVVTLIADALAARWPEFAQEYTRQRLEHSPLSPNVWEDAASDLPLAPDASVKLLGRVWGLAAAPESVLLLDSPPGGGEAFALFGRLRDVLWQLPHTWVVAANDALRAELTRPPATAFFDVQLNLSPFSAEQQRDFLSRRVADEEQFDVDAIVGRTDGYPRSVLQLARSALVATGPVNAWLAERDQKREPLRLLSPTASEIVEWLATHGATSGSDPALLALLGISGQRVRQILRSLESDGLVHSFAAMPEGQGRPRKLYELSEGVR